MKFDLGKIITTGGFRRKTNIDLTITLLNRHINGDLGDLDEDDRNLNEKAISDGNRILSMYLVNGQKIYILTEWDRSYTTIMLAEEY